MQKYRRPPYPYSKELVTALQKFLILCILVNSGHTISNNNKRKLKAPKRKDFPAMTRRAILTSQNYACRLCFCYLDVYEFDHIDGNRSNNSYYNCQALCPTCHTRKSKREKEMRKWLNYW